MKGHKFAAIGSVVIAICFFAAYYLAGQNKIHFLLGAVWLFLGINQAYQISLARKREEYRKREELTALPPDEPDNEKGE